MMKQQNNYTLYFLRALIVILIAWLSSAMFNPAINSNENALQQSLIKNQISNSRLLDKSAKYIIDDLEEMVNKRPDDRILPNTYHLAEKECNLTLDTLNQIFSNQNISNQALTEQVKTARKNLDENLWTILQDFEKEFPIITKEEIIRFYKMFPQFSYSINSTNKDLVKELIIGEITEIKVRFIKLLSSRISGNPLNFLNFYSAINTSTFKKNQLSTMEILFVPNGKQAPAKRFYINNKSVPFIDGVARYKNTFKDSLSQKLIVKSELEIPYDRIITLQDTFIIHPTQKH